MTEEILDDLTLSPRSESSPIKISTKLRSARQQRDQRSESHQNRTYRQRLHHSGGDVDGIVTQSMSQLVEDRYEQLYKEKEEEMRRWKNKHEVAELTLNQSVQTLMQQNKSYLEEIQRLKDQITHLVCSLVVLFFLFFISY